MLAAPRPGQPFWPFYNLTMVLVLYLGVAGFLAHAFAMHHRGWGWVIAKCLGLVLAWTGMILTLEALAA